MTDTDTRLSAATCAKHAKYTHICVYCTRNYYFNLIESDYTPNCKVEDMRRLFNYDLAHAKSRIAELEYEIACYESSGV